MNAHKLGAVLLLAAVASQADVYDRGGHPLDYLDEDDLSNVDVEGSLDYPHSEEKRLSFGGDIRGGYFNVDADLRDGNTDHTDEFAMRIRYGANFGFTDHARLKARLAGSGDSDGLAL